MNRGFICRYFDYSKEHGADLGLGFLQGGRTLWLPHWQIRSKAKHFALGLLDLEVPPEGYFYLGPHFHPEWIFSFLAALSLGLCYVSLPDSLDPAHLESLVEKYPPSLYYGSQSPTEEIQKILNHKKTLKSFVLGGVSKAPPANDLWSFRQIHNRGIMAESRHYKHYRQRREKTEEAQVLSPIQIDFEGTIQDKEFKASHLQAKLSAWEAHLTGKKVSRLFTQVDFSRTLDLMLSLFWPLATGKTQLLASSQEHWLKAVPPYHPQLAYLRPHISRQLAQSLILGKTPLEQKAFTFLGKRRARKKLGGSLQEIWSPEPYPEELGSFYKKLGISTWVPE